MISTYKKEYDNFLSSNCFEENKLGVGSLGQVHEVVWNGRMVAIKIIYQDLMDVMSEKKEDFDFNLKQFDKECGLLRTLSGHKNIICFLGVERSSNNYPIGLYQEKATELETYLSREDIVSFNISHKLIRGLYDGLKHIHEKGYAHYNIRNANTFVGYDTHLKIGDFGSSVLHGGCDNETKKDIKDSRSCVVLVMEHTEYSSRQYFSKCIVLIDTGSNLDAIISALDVKT